uniref:Uncharacterized protein n=1 Tax=Populus trichocarpa TaxID=3694 RepID=A0A3N7EQL3_POPTR
MVVEITTFIKALGNLTTVPRRSPSQKLTIHLKIGRTSSSDQQIMDHSHEVSLDINELANSLREQLKIKKAFSQACRIYRVPERLRKLNEKAYTPRAVSKAQFTVVRKI